MKTNQQAMDEWNLYVIETEYLTKGNLGIWMSDYEYNEAIKLQRNKKLENIKKKIKLKKDGQSV